MFYRRLLWGMIALLALVGSTMLAGPVLASPPAQANALQNPGFNDPFVPFNGNAGFRVAQGWLPWYVSHREGDEPFRNQPPTYQPASAENAARVREGSNAQEYFSFYQTHTGGVYQQVSVTSGAQVQFSVYAYVWSTNLGDVNLSENPGRVQIQVGIDPNGGTNGESEQIIWSAPLEFYDEYRQLAVETTASGGTITVFVRSTFDQPQMHNNVFLDQAALTVGGAQATVTTPPPTATATPTQTRTSTSPPTSTTAPTATNTVTVPPPATQAGFPTPTQELGTGEPSNTPGTGPSATPTTPTATQSGPTATASPTRTPVPVSTLFPQQISYVVVRGDTVGALAQRFGSSIEAIIAVNGLNADALIFVGQTLTIPVTGIPTATPAVYPTPIPTSIGILPTNTPVVGSGGPVGPTTTYVVQRGDTLTHISARFNTTVLILAQMNGILNPNLIHPGQTLFVPGTTTPTPVPPTVVPGPRVHVVQRGENLFRISLRYGVPLPTIARANNIYNVNLVYAGQVLVIP